MRSIWPKSSRARYRFLAPSGRRFIGPGPWDPTQWSDPQIWNLLVISRHYGLPSRLLDWSESVWVAAYFAACDGDTEDGAIWWFAQGDFESAVHKSWDNPWHVPHMKHRRAMERRSV